MEFVSFEDQMVNLSQLKDSSSIGEIHEIEAFQKSVEETQWVLLPNGRYMVKSPLVRMNISTAETLSLVTSIGDADANGISVCWR